MSEKKPNTTAKAKKPNINSHVSTLQTDVKSLERSIETIQETLKMYGTFFEDYNINQTANDTFQEIIKTAKNTKNDILQNSDDAKSHYADMKKNYDAIATHKTDSDIVVGKINIIHTDLTAKYESIAKTETELAEKITKSGEILSTQEHDVQSLTKKNKQLFTESNKLFAESNKLYQELIDKSLHSAFKKEANRNKWSHTGYSFLAMSSLATILVILLSDIFGFKFYDDLGLSFYELSFFKISLSVPLVFIYRFCSHTAKIKLKLGEEYQHKASMTEMLLGYRNMWELKHEDAEYQNIFKLISEDLAKNPADKVIISTGDIGLLSKRPFFQIVKKEKEKQEENL